MSALAADLRIPGAYDRAKRRRGLRKGGERGISIYIPMVELRKAGCDPRSDAPVFYRVWGSRRGSVLVRLYREERR
jgi:hypothetical protein